jgi:hypothetical protein
MNKMIGFLASSAIAVCAGAFALSAITPPAVAAGAERKIRRFNVEFFTGGAQCGEATFTYDPITALYGTLHTGCAQSNPIPGIGIVVKKNWNAMATLPRQAPPSCTGTKELEFEETIVNGIGSTEGDIYFLNYPLVSGACWWEYASQDGVAVGLVASGTYNVVK